jgi:AcrR family transcriptional regulator
MGCVPERGDNTRDRLLRAAAELLDEAQGGDVSTRAVCKRAGVQAPTLYHHFGNKDGLLQAVVEYGTHQYTPYGNSVDAEDFVTALRRGWDDHVRYGLDNPSFYALLYGRIKPGVPCAVTAVAERRLIELLQQVENAGLLNVSCEEAAHQIVAANVGVTLYLIGRDDGRRDLGLSDQLRDNILAGLLDESTVNATAPRTNRAGRIERRVADAAAAVLSGIRASRSTDLTPGEAALLTELLQRLSSR